MVVARVLEIGNMLHCRFSKKHQRRRPKILDIEDSLPTNANKKPNTCSHVTFI